MEILAGIGVGQLHFGITKSQVFERLGFPNKSYISESGAREVQYFGLKLVLKFEPDNEDRLGWIEIHNKDSVVFGISPWDKPQLEVIEFFTRSLGEPPVPEIYNSFESFTFPKNWIELQFQFGELSCINIGVNYDDNDCPLNRARIPSVETLHSSELSSGASVPYFGC